MYIHLLLVHLYSQLFTMAILIRSEERGKANHGWLNAKHTFSFAGYYNPERVHFGMLRVLNDDIVAPGMGFGMHPHDNMEIITIPLYGQLEHKDNMGNKKVITAAEVQIMSAGTGVVHSEYNPSQTEEVNLFQIWIFPKEKNIAPRYDQKIFSITDRQNKFQTVVSPDKDDSSLWINQDAYISLAKISEGTTLNYSMNKIGNGAFAMIIKGNSTIENEILDTRDAIGINDKSEISITANETTEVLVIEVPMN